MNEFDLRKFLYNNPLMEKKEDSKKGNKEEQKRMKGAIEDDADHIEKLKKDLKADKKKLSKLKKDEPMDVNEMKKQGYDDREDESLGARRGAEKDKEQSMKDRRDDSYGKFGKRDAEKKGKNKINKEGVVKEDEQFVGNDINANSLLNILAEYLPTNHYHQDKTLSYDEALEMVTEFVKFVGMDSTGEDFLNHIMDTEDSIKEEMSKSYSEDGDTAMDKRAKTIRDREQAQIEKDARKKGLTKEGLKDMIKERITSILNEEGKDMAEGAKYYEDDMKEAEEVDVDVDEKEDIDVDIEKDVKIDDESEEMDIEVDAEVAGQSAEDSGLEGLLKKAREMARKQGDDKLVRQISNTIIQHERSIAADEEA